MKNKHFTKTIPLEFWMRMVSILLVVVYSLIAVWFWLMGSVSLDFGFYLIAFVSSIGVVYKKEWARKTLIGISAVSLIYTSIHMVFFLKQADSLSVLFMILFAGIIYFYRLPKVKAEFGSSHSPRILLIDDDKTLLRMMSANFLSKGITLLTADSGEKGLEIASRKDLDLIILDVILPKMKGREVCNRLKENSRTKDVPIVFLTVKDSPDDINAELEAGAVSHLTKPVDFENLYKQINKILGR